MISSSNSALRALAKYLGQVEAKDVPNLNIPTGLPYVYELDEKFKLKKHYFLATKSEIEAGINKVKNQIRAKG